MSQPEATPDREPQGSQESPEAVAEVAARRDATVMELAQVIADSRSFPECRSPAAAAVRILAGREMGIGPIAAVSGIRVSNGRVSMDAVLMAGSIRRSADYDYKVAEHTAENCILHFHRRGELVGVSTFSIADAKQAGLLGTKGETWTKYPRNMLFARALSNGARWYCPDIFGGSVYTHEELGVTVDEEGRAVEANSGAGADNDLCTREQREEIRRLAAIIGGTEADLLSHLGIQVLDELSGYEAGKLLRKMQKKVAAAGGYSQPLPQSAPQSSPQPAQTPVKDSAGVTPPGSTQDAAAPAPTNQPREPSAVTIQKAVDESKQKSTPIQQQAIWDLACALVPDEREREAMLLSAFERRGCKALWELNQLQAADLIERLQAKIAEQRAEAAKSQAPFDVPGAERSTTAGRSDASSAIPAASQ